jgi:hypothetical protein
MENKKVYVKRNLSNKPVLTDEEKLAKKREYARLYAKKRYDENPEYYLKNTRKFRGQQQNDKIKTNEEEIKKIDLIKNINIEELKKLLENKEKSLD